MDSDDEIKTRDEAIAKSWEALQEIPVRISDLVMKRELVVMFIRGACSQDLESLIRAKIHAENFLTVLEKVSLDVLQEVQDCKKRIEKFKSK